MRDVVAAEASADGARWYRGDCHVHSHLSNGADLTPEQLVGEARAAGLDFIVVTEHNAMPAYAEWERLGTGDLLVVRGQEAVTRNGHWLALGLPPHRIVDWRYGIGDDAIERHLDDVREAGGLCAAAHPQAPYPSGALMYPVDLFDAVEVWNGPWASERPWNANNECALAEWGRSLASGIHRGRWLPAIGNSDAHLEGQIGEPRTIVLAEELTASSVLAGLRAGHCWIAASGGIELSLAASAAGRRVGIGGRLSARGESVTVRLVVRGVPSGLVTVHTDRGAVHREALPTAPSGTVVWETSAATSMFVRIELRHPDGMMAAVTNPIVLA